MLTKRYHRRRRPLFRGGFPLRLSLGVNDRAPAYTTYSIEKKLDVLPVPLRYTCSVVFRSKISSCTCSGTPSKYKNVHTHRHGIPLTVR
jgi:hypothetical protein